MLELLFLLLPIAAISGWWLAKKDTKRNSTNWLQPGFSKRYFSGINFLLNEEPDKAIEQLLQVIDINKETFDTHLAIGSLFRKRGETDRAIKIHQNLIARPNISKRQRSDALLELGRDYLAAGVFDRAEKLFVDLVKNKQQIIASLKHLIDIYQQQKDWQQAIATAQHLELATGSNMGKMISHYYCELADISFVRGDLGEARKFLRQALTNNYNSVRASINLGKLELSLGNFKNALKHYKRIKLQDMRYVAETIEPLSACYHATNQKQEFENYLQQYLEVNRTPQVVQQIKNKLKPQQQSGKALQFLQERLQQEPSLQGLLSYILLLDYIAAPDACHWQQIKKVAEAIVTNQANYTCSECGFLTKSMLWLCPGCKQWDTIFATTVMEVES